MERDLRPAVGAETCKPHFNPRAPHGARQFTFSEITELYLISIHALRMERDGDFLKFFTTKKQFQSTRSAWSATQRLPGKTEGLTMERDALRMERDRSLYEGGQGIPISIHALLMERDG